MVPSGERRLPFVPSWRVLVLKKCTRFTRLRFQKWTFFRLRKRFTDQNSILCALFQVRGFGRSWECRSRVRLNAPNKNGCLFGRGAVFLSAKISLDELSASFGVLWCGLENYRTEDRGDFSEVGVLQLV